MLHEHTPTKLYWKIGDIAKALGVEASAIRYWETAFSLPTPRNHNGNRRYTVTEIGQIAIIARLTRHFHIKAALSVYQKGIAERVLDILEPSVSEPVGCLMKLNP